MNTLVLSLVRCPVCQAALVQNEDGKGCFCNGPRRHFYDYSKTGRLHLGGSHAGLGDGKEAVRARRAFLEAGYYEPLSNAINLILDDLNASSILDAGCGEGYYTNRMAKEGRVVLGVDLSNEGTNIAAKQAKSLQKSAGFVLCSLFTLPVEAHALDAVTSIFAPCSEEEFSRVLKDGGHLILVGAGERHLMGLKEILYEDPYLNPGRADLPHALSLVKRQRLTYSIRVESQEHIAALFSMTPYYWRTPKDRRAHLDTLEHLETEVDFDIFLYRKDPRA